MGISKCRKRFDAVRHAHEACDSIAKVRGQIIGDGLRFVGRGSSTTRYHVSDNDRPIAFAPGDRRYAFEVVA